MGAAGVTKGKKFLFIQPLKHKALLLLGLH